VCTQGTAKKVLRDVFVRGDAWFRTGDLLRRDGAGYYYFVDRIGDTFRTALGGARPFSTHAATR
jgi:acyl-CoA synthetase (AMP-forming)/AMP-acid ligase II